MRVRTLVYELRKLGENDIARNIWQQHGHLDKEPVAKETATEDNRALGKRQPAGRCGGLRELSDPELVARVNRHRDEEGMGLIEALADLRVSKDRYYAATKRMTRDR